MKAEQARKLTSQALTQLASELDQGASDTLTAYLGTMARFYRYSFGNILLIASQQPDATQVAGFGTWKKLSRFVKKGEKGIVIIAPVVIRKEQVEDGDKDTALRFKAAYVFDISQTDGEALPEFSSVSGNPSGHADHLKAFVTTQGINLEFSDNLGGAHGVSRGGSISILNTLEPAQEFSVLVHELAHELLHQSKGKDRPCKTVRETEAEAVAFVVNHAIGLETNSASSDYIKLYRGDSETLASSLERIQKTASRIIEAILPR